MKSRENTVLLQMEAIGFLRALKRGHTYEELSEIFRLSPVVLNRYIKGRVLPRAERAQQMLKLRDNGLLAAEVKRLIRYDADRFINNTDLVFNTDLLAAIAQAERHHFAQADKILTAAVDGMPLAIHMAHVFGVDCVFAKKEKEIGVEDFLESHYKLENGRTLSYAIPKAVLKPGECILIVDDLIRSGETQKILIDLAQKSRATVVGVFALINVGQEGLRAAQQVLPDGVVRTIVSIEGIALTAVTRRWIV